MKQGFDLKELDEKLRLVQIFKEKKPATFLDAYMIAAEAGIGKNKVILEALEIYGAGIGFGVK